MGKHRAGVIGASGSVAVIVEAGQTYQFTFAKPVPFAENESSAHPALLNRYVFTWLLVE